MHDGPYSAERSGGMRLRILARSRWPLLQIGVSIAPGRTTATLMSHGSSSTRMRIRQGFQRPLARGVWLRKGAATMPLTELMLTMRPPPARSSGQEGLRDRDQAEEVDLEGTPQLVELQQSQRARRRQSPALFTRPGKPRLPTDAVSTSARHARMDRHPATSSCIGVNRSEASRRNESRHLPHFGRRRTPAIPTHQGAGRRPGRFPWRRL